MTGTAAWVARTDSSSIDVGLDRKEALVLGQDLIARLRNGEVSTAGINIDDGVLDVLHAAVEIIASDGAVDVDGALEDASRLHHFISAVDWPEPNFAESAELLQTCSLWAWRLARSAGKHGVAEAWARHIVVRDQPVQDFRDDPERIFGELLGVARQLRQKLEVDPQVVREEAKHLCGLLLSPKRPFGLVDEREYFLGEFALLAGTACRLLAFRSEARQWFDRAEGNFRLTVNAVADYSRVSYQRLALMLEERNLEALFEQLPALVQTFESLGMQEDALKCRFLESSALHETGRTPEAITLLRDICAKAEELRIPRLAAMAATNLAQDYRVLGDLKEALAYAGKALPLLEQLNNRVSLTKLRWCAGDILREQGKLGEAIETYRAALRDSEEIGMRGDQAALHLVLADVLLVACQDRQAEWEIRAALPIIDEEKMVPEGYAALSLLRQSLQSHRINGEALRNLHVTLGARTNK